MHLLDTTHWRHIQFLISAPNFRGLADPHDTAFPNPCLKLSRSS